MARRRDIIIGIAIIFSFLIVFGFLGLMFVGAFYGDSEISVGGLGSKVAVVEVFGTIYNSEPIVKQLKKWGKAPSVKAIVLHIDSPGGGVSSTQEIYDEILRIRKEDKKIIIVSMASIAASGAYYISCAADKIMANPGTLVGSIGVIIQFYTAGKLLEKVGIEIAKVKSGNLKDVGSLDRPMTDKEREMLTAVVVDTYEQFVKAVSEGRGMDKGEIYPLADGSIFTGRQASELGLVDTLGGFEDAIRYAANMAGIKGEPRIIKEVKQKSGIFDLIGSTLGGVREIASGDIGGPRVMYLY